MKKNPKIVKSFRLIYLDGTSLELPIERCTIIKKGHQKEIKVRFHVDHLGDNKHLIIIGEELLSEGKLPDRIEIIREEK